MFTYFFCRLAYHTQALDAQDWAAWVQAVGSILAIAAGVLTLWWQGRREERKAIAEEVRRLRIIGSGIFHCRVKAKAIAESLLGPGAIYKNARTALRREVAVLAAIPLLEIPDARVCMAVSNIVTYYERVEQEAAVPYSAETQEKYRAAVVKQLNVLLGWLNTAEKMTQDALQARGANVIYQVANVFGTVIETPKP